MFHVKHGGRCLKYLCFFSFFLLLRPSFLGGVERVSLPSWGQGPCEVIIFSDYFCPPCQSLERELKPLLINLYHRGRVKVSFADLFLYRLTPLYNRYFFFAVGSYQDLENVLRVREVLFALAARIGALNEKQLEREFVSQKISFSTRDVRPWQAEINHLAAQYGIFSTPSAVILCPARPLLIARGSREIVFALKEHISQGD